MTRAELYLKLYGPLAFGCGPSGAEKQAQSQEASFTNTLMANYQTNFANNASILAHLNSTLSPIVAAGPSQTGFSPSERAAMETRALNTTGGNYASAARALGGELAGRSSGNLPESGVDKQLKEQLASSAAGELSQEQLGITSADYATGRSNFRDALSAEEGVAAGYSPTALAGEATKANQASFGEADTIAQQQSQEESDIAGGVTSLAGAGLGFFGAGGGKKGLTALAGGL